MLHYCIGDNAVTIIFIDRNDPTPLTDQIAQGIRQLIEDKTLRQGARLPSVRKFAIAHEVSSFTVVQAYDKLVAMGYLVSRQGSGFFVTQPPKVHPASEGSYQPDSAVDVTWLLRNALGDRSRKVIPGAWWLPAEWMAESGLSKSLRSLSQKKGEFLSAYGTPAGYQPLRELLQHKLAAINVTAEVGQIVLTSGVTHALDLVMRYFVRPGDAVLVDDPGFFILFGGLKSFGAKIVGVPWNEDGPDIPIMEALIKEHKPRIYFTNTVLHNPTGVSISLSVAHRMLQLAEKYDLMLVEDDIYGDFHPENATRLATLDQLDRVIYVSSFSKTISASLRVGYFACKRELAEKLCNVKLLTGLTTSEVSEQVIYQLLASGHYRKYLEKLRNKLHTARTATIARLESLGFTIYAEPAGGMFLWAKLGDTTDVRTVAAQAAQEGIMLAPGNVFRPHQETSPWMRFNVAHCHYPQIFEFLAGVPK
jgi:DNA-binding transcriptional MocR family regulator